MKKRIILMITAMTMIISQGGIVNAMESPGETAALSDCNSIEENPVKTLEIADLDTDDYSDYGQNDALSEEFENQRHEIMISGSSDEYQMSGKCGDNLTWERTEDGSMLTISGFGDMYDFDDDNPAPWVWWSQDNKNSQFNLITNVTLPDGLTSIGNNAFRYDALTDVDVPNSVTRIGDYAFYGTVLTHITIPDSVSIIGEQAFTDCNYLTSIRIPSSVTTIGDHAFDWCTSLTSVTIPDSVTSIGESAFWGCTSLTSVTIPHSVTSIGEKAFGYCSGLESMTIPDSVTSIGKKAFEFCTGMKSITIPTSITRLESDVFAGCGLTSLKIPDSVIEISNSAFNGCSGLTSLTIPETVKDIGPAAFADCTGLESIVLPGSLEGLGISAFRGCSSLKSVTIPDGWEIVGQWWFKSCSSLSSITIPVSMEVFWPNAFEDCNNISDVYYDGTESQWNKISNHDILSQATIHYANSPKGFVCRFYEVVLGRAPETEGLYTWSDQLASGEKKGADIAQGFYLSPEMLGKGLSNEDYVEAAYQGMMGRASDKAGKKDWVEALQCGVTYNAIIRGFVGSQEFKNLCAEYHIDPGEVVATENRDKNVGVTRFVSRLYTEALGRNFDVDGLNDWCGRIIDNPSRENILNISTNGFFHSSEFIEKNLKNDDFVYLLYHTYLDRIPDPCVSE